MISGGMTSSFFQIFDFYLPLIVVLFHYNYQQPTKYEQIHLVIIAKMNIIHILYLCALYYKIINFNSMKNAQIINDFIKSENYKHLMENKQIDEQTIKDIIKEYFPKIGIVDKLILSTFMSDDQLFDKMQRIFEAHQEIYSRIESIEQQINQKSRNNEEPMGLGAGKKITRAALARRHEKNQQQIRKDQIFVRLAPKSQSCIQFMLSNRNFPRLQCKLSCNQHLQYLVNYLTNKWIRGKVGFKIVLYPDNSFLKSMPLPQKQKALKEPLNNYLMFTDIMACCGIHQNGILDLCYEIVEIKKMIKPNTEINENVSGQASENMHMTKINAGTAKQKNKGSLSIPDFNSSFQDKISKGDARNEVAPNKIVTPSKFTSKQEASIFNRNSYFFNEESMFGSLGFNYNFAPTPTKRDDHLLSINSINYHDPQFQQAKRFNQAKLFPQSSPKEDNKLDQKEEIFKEFIVPKKIKQEASQQVSYKSNNIQKELKKQNSQQRQNMEHKPPKQQVQDIKLGTLMSFLQQMQKQKPNGPSLQIPISQDDAQNNNSNKVKDVKVVNIVKRRNNP